MFNKAALFIVRTITILELLKNSKGLSTVWGKQNSVNMVMPSYKHSSSITQKYIKPSLK